MSYANTIILCTLVLACGSAFVLTPVQAFTANSLDITIDKNGDAIATFRFTLQGIIENAIPQSVLEEELKKGLTTSAEPPELISMDRSSAVLRMKKFAETTDVPTGTSYLTGSMDFKKAEIALQQSALSSVVSADFSPETITLTFPDSYQRAFSNIEALPAISHIVVDPSKIPQTTEGPVPEPVATGSMNVTSSPLNVKVYLDSVYLGEAPALFPAIAAGTHMAEFRRDGFESVTKDVTILEGRTTNVMVVLRYIPPVTTEETPPGSSLPVLAIALLVLIAVIVGGYYLWSRKKKMAWAGEEEPETAPVNKPAEARVKESGDTRAGTPPAAPASTIVRVTMLKDLPESKTGDDDTRDKQE